MNWVWITIIIIIVLLGILVIAAILLWIFYPNPETVFGEKRQVKVRNIGVVIARYNESLDWLNCKEIDRLKQKYNVKIYIYNKGYTDVDLPDCKVIKLPNVGVNNHTNLYHIITNYDNLDDITLFLPGSAHHKDKKKLTSMLLEKCEEYEYVFTYVVNLRKLRRFAVNKYLNRCKINKSSNVLSPCSIRPYGEWYKHVMGKKVGNTKVNYMDIFSLSKNKIRSYPKKHYERIISFCDKDKLTETAHYIERLWYDMYS